MNMLNTHNNKDLQRYAQALMLLNYHEKVALKDIILLEFSGTNVLVNYLLFKIKNVVYKYRNSKLSIDMTETYKH